MLADYAELISHLKATLPGAAECPVVSFGGSYGAKLTAYLRIKYPHIVVGGLASSASIGYNAPNEWASHGIDEWTWSDIVSRVYDAHGGCLDQIRNAVRLVAALGETTAGRAQLQQAFNLCAPPQVDPDSGMIQGLLDWFTDAIETIPQLNYPYPVPPFRMGWPVNDTCRTLTTAQAGGSAHGLLMAAAAITSTFYGSGGAACFDGVGQGGIPGGGPVPAMALDPVDDAWGFQSCTETLHRFSSRGVRNFTFSLPRVTAVCKRSFGVEPDSVWPELAYGGFSIAEGRTTASNIIFSSGLLDPWHGGGFLRQWTASCPVLLMPGGAHHLDLRGPHPLDPADVTAARAEEERIIRGWIDEFAAAPRTSHL